MNRLPDPDEMYRALVRRDGAYDGLFYACVKTTGIFCRPVCHARKPKPENVDFVATVREALFGGFRPCKVCHPLERPGAPAWVSELLDAVRSHPGERIKDGGLRERGIEPARARRWFKRHYGMTFHAYQRAWRLGAAMKRLREGTDTLRAGYEAGWESPSGFRDAFRRLFGAPPRRGAGDDVLLATWIETPLGPMLALGSERGLVLLEFVDRRALETQIATVRRRLGRPVVPGRNDALDQIDREIAEYFDGHRRTFDVALDVPGTDFQRAVWDRLRAVGYGEIATYADIAAAIGHPRACRAVGRANGDNRLAIVIPCHRVIRADGGLCGYGGGLWRKRWLLDHERARVSVASETSGTRKPAVKPRSNAIMG